MFGTPASGQQIRSLRGHETDVRTAEFNAAGTQLLTASGDRSAQIWDLADGTALQRFDDLPELAYVAAFGPDKKTIVTAGDDGYATLWDIETGAELQKYGPHDSAIWDVDLHPDGKFLATAGADQLVKVWQIETGAKERSFAGQGRRSTLGNLWCRRQDGCSGRR